MAQTDTSVDPSAQQSIEMPNGIVLTGVGGDVDAIRDTLEERHEEQHSPATKASPIAATTDPEPPKKTRGQKRFDELTAAVGDEKRRADAAEAKLKELEAKAPAAVVAAPVVTAPAILVPAARTKPTEDMVGSKYQTYSDFVEDLADWKAEQREVKLRADLDAQSTQRIEADRASRTRMDFVNTTVFPAGRAAYPDFDAVLSSNTTMTPGIVHEAILKLPNPEHALYVLAKDQAKLDSIIALATDPLKLGIAIAQLMPRESVASPASTAPVVRTTNAPAPIQPVGAGTRTTSPTIEELAQKGDYEAYKAARKAQRAS